jgi:hypothetical protein
MISSHFFLSFSSTSPKKFAEGEISGGSAAHKQRWKEAKAIRHAAPFHMHPNQDRRAL